MKPLIKSRPRERLASEWHPMISGVSGGVGLLNSAPKAKCR
jgi:hypothetical protein